MRARWWRRIGLLAIVLGALSGRPAVVADEPPSAVGPVLKLFQSGRVPAERQGTVVEMICDRGNEHDLKVVFDRVVQPDGFPPALRLQAMDWLAEAATTRKVKPAGKLDGLVELVTGKDAQRSPELRTAAIRLASIWKDPAVSPALQQLATDPQAGPEVRQAAVEGLIAIGDPASRSTLETLTRRGQPLPTRMQAVRGVASFDLPGAAAAAVQVLADATPQDDPAPLLDAFLLRKGGAEVLAAALEKQPPARDVAKRALRYMYSVGRSDAPLSNALSLAAGIAADAPPPTPEEVAQIVQDVIAKGDPRRGEEIFRRADLNCMKCHSVSRAGGQVGPELSAVGGSSPVDYIVNSILNPNLAIKEQYITRVFVLATGQVLTGVVVDRDEVRVNIRDANGQLVTVPAADIEEEFEGKSLMPQGLTKFLTRDELLDLAKFISELGKPGPYAVQQGKTLQRWRVLRDPPPELVEEVPHLESIRQFVLGSSPEAWQPAYGKVSGVLPLQELRPANDPAVLILQGEIEVKTAGAIAVEITSTEPYQAWFAAQPLTGSSPFLISPEPGRHTLILRVELSERAEPELRVEFKTPDGSPVIFEVVGGA